MNTELTEVKSEQTETALYLLTKAEIDTQIATAKAFPRSIKKFMDKAMSIATLTEDIAASCNYAVPRGGKAIEGKSIRLAEITLSAYGNVHSGARIISNDGRMITAQGVCWDLETNNRVTKEVVRKITGKNGQTFSEDMQIVTGNAACSIALRNAVFATIPSALTDEIYEKTKEVARGTAETLVGRRTKAVECFKGWGVTDKKLCEALGVAKIEDIDLEKLTALTGMKAAIKNGESTVKDLFDTTPVTINVEDLQTLFDIKVDALTEDEKKNGERILSNKETASYPKLHLLLQSK